MFKTYRIALSTICLTTAAPWMHAQRTAQQPLNNAAVLRLAASGTSEEQIVQTITTSAGYYNMESEALDALQKAGVTQQEIDAMRKKDDEDAAAAAAIGTVIPPGVHGIGVYYKDPQANEWVESKPETVQYIQACGIKTGCGKADLATNIGSLVPIVGPAIRDIASIPITVQKIKDFDRNGYISGKTAELAFNHPAEILIYAPADTSPKQYHLLKLRIDANLPDVRIFDRGGVVNGYFRGNLPKRDAQAFKATKLGDRLYQITLGPEYQPGDYGLLLPNDGDPTTDKIFTFRVVE